MAKDHKVYVLRDVKFLSEPGSEDLYQEFAPEEDSSHQGNSLAGVTKSEPKI